MKAIIAVLVFSAAGWGPAAVAQHGADAEPAVSRAGETTVAQAWRDKLDGLKRQGGQKKDRSEGADGNEKEDLPAGDCKTYPIGCGPGYSNPKLRGIDCGGRSEIGCLCWKDLASKQECDAYRAAKDKKK